MQSCPIFMPGQSVIGRFATLDSSSVTCPEKPGSMKPAVECVSSPSRPSGLLPSSRPASWSPSEIDLQRRGEHELPRVQHERLAVGHLDQRGQVVLLHRRVDVGVEVVVEDPEQPVQSHVDAGRLNQGGLERLQAQRAGLDLGDQVAVGEQHRTTIAAPPKAVGFGAQ